LQRFRCGPRNPSIGIVSQVEDEREKVGAVSERGGDVGALLLGGGAEA
jgi:hypothetical protein